MYQPGWYIRDAMKVDGLTDPHKRGLHAVKVAKLTFEQKYEFSQAVNQLADWFRDGTMA